MNQLIFLRDLLYNLKREYGTQVEFFRTSNTTTNFKTGAQIADKFQFTLRKVIRLPADISRNFSYDLSFIAANKNFTYGGTYDKTVERLIVDAKDVVTNFMFDVEDYAAIGNKRYIIRKIEELKEQVGYLLIVESIEGDSPNRLETKILYHGLNFSQRVLYEF